MNTRPKDNGHNRRSRPDMARTWLAELAISTEQGLLSYCLDEHQDTENRAKACVIAGWLNIRTAVPVLIELATDDASGVVGGATNGLAEIGSRRATRPLMRFIGHSRVDDHRIAAILCLGRIGDDRAEQLILRLLVDQSESARVRHIAAEALRGVHRRGRSVDPIVKALGDPSPSVRWSVLTTLGCFGDQRAIKAIRECLSDQAVVPGMSPDEDTVAWAAKNALTNLGIPLSD